MRAIVIGACLLACGTLVSGCADEYYGDGGYGYGYYGGGPVVYEGYYDDYYGPFYNGYWAADGFYYYSDRDGRYHRDRGHHFRHDQVQGYHAVRGQRPPPPPPRESRRDHY